MQVDFEVTATNNDLYCAPALTWATLTPAAGAGAAFQCNRITIVIVPDINRLEQSYVAQRAFVLHVCWSLHAVAHSEPTGWGGEQGTAVSQQAARMCVHVCDWVPESVAASDPRTPDTHFVPRPPPFLSLCLCCRYSVVNSQNRVLLQGGYEDNSTIYCGPPGETLTAIFRDAGGDGRACTLTAPCLVFRVVSAVRSCFTAPPCNMQLDAT